MAILHYLPDKGMTDPALNLSVLIVDVKFWGGRRRFYLRGHWDGNQLLTSTKCKVSVKLLTMVPSKQRSQQPVAITEVVNLAK